MSDERPADDHTSAEPAPAEPDGRPANQGPRGRCVLAAVFWLLASLLVLVGGITLWAHQTLLTANGWGGLVAEVIEDEEVTEAISVVIVERLADASGIRETVAGALPGPDIIGRAVTGVVEDRVVKGFFAINYVF